MAADYSICLGAAGWGVWHSPDAGKSWIRHRAPFPLNSRIQALVAHPTEAHTLHGLGRGRNRRRLPQPRRWGHLDAPRDGFVRSGHSRRDGRGDAAQAPLCQHGTRSVYQQRSRRHLAALGHQGEMAAALCPRHGGQVIPPPPTALYRLVCSVRCTSVRTPARPGARSRVNSARSRPQPGRQTDFYTHGAGSSSSGGPSSGSVRWTRGT
jgi:hypothetical protein